MKNLTVLIILAFSLLFETEGKSKTCSAGELMNGDGTCSSCPPGTYRSESNHTYTSCIVCHPKKENVEVHHDCNATHNTGSPIGSFQSQANPLVCQLCQVCDVFEARPCTSTSDAVCCPFKNMSLAEKANDGVSCKCESSDGKFCCEFKSQTTNPRVSIDTKIAKLHDGSSFSTDSMKSLTCSRNMYIDQSTNSCKPCNPCSYIDQEVHSQQSCDLCSSDKRRSRLVYCPKQCGSGNNGSLGDGERVLISLILYMIGILLLVAVIFVSVKFLSRCQCFGSPATLSHMPSKPEVDFCLMRRDFCRQESQTRSPSAVCGPARVFFAARQKVV